MITYIVQLDSTVQGGQVITNTATVTNYAGTEGGPNFVPGGISDDGPIQVRFDGLGKDFTSEIINAFNGVTDVVVGELVTYHLTITVHEGVMPNVTIQDTLPSGMAFVGCSSILASPALTTSLPGGFSAACNPPTNPTVSAGGQVVTFDLGTITNSDTNNSVHETVQIWFTAVVLNVLSNQTGTALVNTATMLINGGAGGSATVQSAAALVIEPTVTTTKSVTPATGDAGDTVTFTLTLANPGSGSTTAYDVNWTDTIPTGLTYVMGSLVQGPCTASTPPGLAVVGATLSGTGGVFQPGESCTYTFQATLDPGVYPGQVITNTAQTQWTSLPGVVTDRSSYNPDSDERTGADGLLGSGVLNDYRTQGSASVTVANATPVKSIAATSEDSTGPQAGVQRLVVGEIVRYRLQVRWPEGSAVNVRLRDNLPAGLQFLNDNTAKAAFVCNSGPLCMQSTDPGIASSPVVAGNETTVNSIVPTFVLPDQAVSASDTTNNDTYGDGTDPYFKFLDVTNNDSDPDQEFIVVEFNAVVRNVAGNQANTLRNNNFSVLVGTNPAVTSNTVSLRVAEPAVALTKTLSLVPQDAGDPIAFAFVLSNTSAGANRATAFDLELTDVFDAQITGLSVASVTTTQGATCVGPSGLGTVPFSHNGGSIVGNTLTFTATCLDPGETITVVVSGTVAAAVPAGYTIGNSALVTYTSLPGPNGTSPNPTGSTTPGGSGTATGERDGRDGVGGALNDYAAQAAASAPLAAPLIDKRSPDLAAAPIGAVVTFPVLVTLPEGTTQNLVVTDLIPSGLVFVSYAIATTVAGSGGLLSADFNGTLPAPTVTAPGGSGDDVSLDFGNVVTNADNDPTTNSFVIFISARVNNEPGNQNGTVLANLAQLAYLDPDTGVTGVSDPNAESVTVIEPELGLAKSVSNTTPIYGETLTYSLTLAHLGSSTSPAYDITLTDTVPSGLTYVAGSITAPPGWTASDAGAPTLVWTCSNPCSLPVGSSVAFSYQAVVNGPPGPPNPGDTLTNTASASWTSLDGPSAFERTGADGVGGLNDYVTSASQNVTLTVPELGVTKDDGVAQYVPGGTLTYTVVVSNTGNGPATGVTVTDPKPAQITTWSWSCVTTGGATCTGSGGPIATTFTDTVTMPAGSTITYTVLANIDPAATGDLTNTATVAHPADTTPGNNSASDVDQANPQADLSVTKTDGQTQYVPGGTLTYTVVVSNAGPSNVAGVTVTDPKPAQITTWSWSCVTTGGATCTGSGGPIATTFTDTVTMPAGSTITYTVTANIDPGATGDIVNTVQVTLPAGVSDPDPSDNTATDTDTTAGAQADLSVTKDDGQTQYVPGGTLTYTVVASNAGPSNVSGVTVTDPKPAQITTWSWSCVTTGGATCTGSGGPIATAFTDTVTMPAGSTITYTVTASIDPAATGDLTNTVTVAHPADTTPSNNAASDTDSPNLTADLVVTKTDGTGTYTPGGTVTYTIVVSNQGPAAVMGATVTDILPPQITSASWTCVGTAGATCSPSGSGNLNDTVNLPAGASVTYTLTATVAPTATGTLVNTASADLPAGFTDPTPNNNASTDADQPYVEAIPTLDFWGLVLLAALILTWGALRLRQAPRAA